MKNKILTTILLLAAMSAGAQNGRISVGVQTSNSGSAGTISLYRYLNSNPDAWFDLRVEYRLWDHLEVGLMAGYHRASIISGRTSHYDLGNGFYDDITSVQLQGRSGAFKRVGLTAKALFIPYSRLDESWYNLYAYVQVATSNDRWGYIFGTGYEVRLIKYAWFYMEAGYGNMNLSGIKMYEQGIQSNIGLKVRL